MRTIHKFTLRVGRWISLPIGDDAKVVLAAIDPASGAPAIWVDHEVSHADKMDGGRAVLTGAPIDGNRLFGVFRTGEELDPDDRHVGSMIDRDFVWHVLERPR